MIFSRPLTNVKTRVFWNPFHRRWAAFYHALFPGGRTPAQWEFQVANYLYHHRYELDQVRAILIFATFWGTVEMCQELRYDDEDREHIERLLPELPDSRWVPYDAFRWELGAANQACA